MNSPQGRRPRERLGRPPMMIVLPLVVVLVLAGIWTVVWAEGSRRADTILGQWLAAEAERGRTYDCAEREIGGFPFRVEIICDAPSVDIADAAPQIVVRAERLRAVALVWRLEHVIVEIDGPLSIESPDADGDTRFALDADWTLLQSSIRAPGGRISRVDVAIEELSAAPHFGALEPGHAVTIAADRFEIHQRHEGPDTELAGSATALVVTVPAEDPTEATDVSLAGRLVALPQPMPRQPADFLAAWRDNDGAVEITELRARQDETVLTASGRLEPDASGRPEGTVTVTLAGPDVTTPGAAGAFGGLAPMMATALRLAGRPSEIDGRSAVSGDLELEDGRLFFGPLPLAEIPPLF